MTERRSPCALDGCEAAPCARGVHPTACVNTAGRTLPCEPCKGTGLFRAKNEPPDDCMTCGGTGWASGRVP